MAPDFSPEALAAAAGVDPWALARKVTDGRPDDVIDAGLAFRRAGQQAVEVAGLGGVADRTTAAAYLTDRVGVWDADAAGRRSRGLLSGGGDAMEEVARVLLLVGDGLAGASGAVEQELRTLTDQLNGVIARRNSFLADTGRILPGDDRAAADRGFLNEAVGLVQACARRIQGRLDEYDQLLRSRTGVLAELGYQPPVIGLDPLTGRSPTTTPAPDLPGTGVLKTPPGARLEGGLTPGINITVPGPGGGLVQGLLPAPDLGAGRTDGGVFPFPVPDGSRVLNSPDGPTPAPGAETVPGEETPAPAPDERQQAAGGALGDGAGAPYGTPDSPGTQIVSREQYDKIVQDVRSGLGEPDRVITVPGKGTVEVWDLDDTGRSNITIRDFSRSGEEGRVAPETIDVNRVPGLPDLKRYHVELP